MTDIAKLEARMLSGEPFTYGQLSKEYAPAHPYGVHDESRIVDRTIQKLRRKGLIVFKREGRLVVWRAVPE